LDNLGTKIISSSFRKTLDKTSRRSQDTTWKVARITRHYFESRAYHQTLLRKSRVTPDNTSKVACTTRHYFESRAYHKTILRKSRVPQGATPKSGIPTSYSSKDMQTTHMHLFHYMLVLRCVWDNPAFCVGSKMILHLCWV